MQNVININLSTIKKQEKLQLADLVGCEIKEYENCRGRCYIVGADKFIDNDFKNIDTVLLYIKDKLMRIGFKIAA